MLINKLRTAFILGLTVFTIFSCSDSPTSSVQQGDDGSGGGGGTEEDTTTEFNSEAPPGSSAEEFLRDDNYVDLAVEIDYMEGHKPSAGALDSLKTFLKNRLNKSTVTIRPATQVSSSGKAQYSLSDIVTLESNHRDHYTTTESDTIQAYFLIVDGEFESNSNALGLTFYNTSMAFFGQAIENLSSGGTAPSREKVEGTVFRHEFGHNLGLVGNGTPTQSDHQTSEGHHCTTDGCLMEPSLESSDSFSNNFSGDIPNLDDLCIEDLRANGGK